jgi:hypothetical protein
MDATPVQASTDLSAGEDVFKDYVFDFSGAQQPKIYSTGPYKYTEDVISGFFIKYGMGSAPSNMWLAGIGYDFGIGRNFALGIEVMPSYSNVSNDSIQFKQATIPFHAFLNVKGGFHFGGLIPFLRFFKIFAGAGGGVGGSYIHTTFEGHSFQKFFFDPAVHLMGGVELDLGFVSLIGEYQKIKVWAKDQDPDLWVDYIVFGLRF